MGYDTELSLIHISVTLSGDNFATTLDGTPIPPFNFSARDVGDADIWRTYDRCV